MSQTESTVTKILCYMDQNGFVCPMPQKWQHVYTLLPDKKRAGGGFDPPAPLILGAWGHTSKQEKRQRFQVHLEYAQKNNVSMEVRDYLMSLSTEEWLHENG